MKVVVIIFTAERNWKQNHSILMDMAGQLTTDIELWLICNSSALPQLSSNLENLPQATVRQIPCNLSFPTVENYLAILQPIIIETAPHAVLMDGSITSKEFATRLAFRIGGRSITGVTAIANNTNGLLVTRGICSFNLNATFMVEESPAVLTLLTHPIADISDNSSLETSPLVLAMGRGIGNKITRDHLCEIACRIGAAVGGTRPAVLDGFLPMERMLGISGSSASPDLCITFGASGATPFIMGINGSKLIVAINSDPRALIFRYCDIGLCDSCENVVEELLKLIPAQTNKPIAD